MRRLTERDATSGLNLSAEADGMSRGIALEAEKRLKRAMSIDDVYGTLKSSANIMALLARIAKAAGESVVEEAIWKAVDSIERLKADRGRQGED